MSLIINPYGFAHAARVAFGYGTAGYPNTSGLDGVGCYTAEHDATDFANDTGAAVAVDQMLLIGVIGGAGASVQCALYANSAAAPGALLGVTDTITVANGDNLLTLATPVNVGSGVHIWAAARCSANISATGVGGGGTQKYKSAAWPTAFADPFGSSSGFSHWTPIQMRGYQ